MMNAKASGDQGDFRLTFDPALQGSAALGWDFEPGNPLGEGRGELEYSRRGNRLDRVRFVEGSFKGGGVDIALTDHLALDLSTFNRSKSHLTPRISLSDPR